MKIIVTLLQEEYISGLKQAEVRSEDKNELLSVTESDYLRWKIGQLLWVAGQTRPDNSFETCLLENKLKNGKVEDIVHANKIIKHKMCLHYENLGH